MKLMHPLLSAPICWREQEIPVLIVEQAAAFREMVCALSEQEQGLSGPFVLSRQYEALECGDCLQVIRDYVELPLHERRMQQSFQKMLNDAAQGLWEETAALQQTMQQYLEKLLLAVELPTEYVQDDGVALWQKALRLQPCLKAELLTERLMEYFELKTLLTKRCCFVLVGVKQFLTEQELLQLYQMAWYQKWHLLILEQRQYPTLTGEKICILDQDLCEIRLDYSDHFV